jgi:3-deoxy-7-phosphoheptulonate synthase
MIVVMRSGASREQVRAVVDKVNEIGFRAHLSAGQERTIIGVIGDERPLNGRCSGHGRRGKGSAHSAPFSWRAAIFHPEDTVVPINGVSVGGDQVVMMAGPCSVESREQMMESAQGLKAAGVHILRGGAFKPRTSPYSFQGLGIKGLEILSEVKEATGMALVTEVMSPEQVPVVAACADILQIGTRNMQNYSLLHAVGESGKPVLLNAALCPPWKNCSCPPSTSSLTATTASCSVSGASAPSRPTRATPSTSVPCRCSSR